MKTSIFLEDGFTQIVLTPETEFERSSLKALREASNISVKEGTFYHCLGGWARQGAGVESTMIVCEKTETEPVKTEYPLSSVDCRP